MALSITAVLVASPMSWNQSATVPSAVREAVTTPGISFSWIQTCRSSSWVAGAVGWGAEDIPGDVVPSDPSACAPPVAGRAIVTKG